MWHHILKSNLISQKDFRLNYDDFKKKCLLNKEKSIINQYNARTFGNPNAFGSMPRIMSESWGGRERKRREGENMRTFLARWNR